MNERRGVGAPLGNGGKRSRDAGARGVGGGAALRQWMRAPGFCGKGQPPPIQSPSGQCLGEAKLHDNHHQCASPQLSLHFEPRLRITMAAIRAPSASFLSAFLPVVRAQLLPQERSIQRITLLRQLQQFRLRASLLPAALVPIPALLGELWDGLLKAVPKKKTSHMKKRHRQMAGKALKDVTALNKCSACGRLKRAHVLCPYCVQSERDENVDSEHRLTVYPRHQAMVWQWLHDERRGRA